MRWLVTGGCGFIGTSLIGRLMAEGKYFVRVVDNLTTGTRENLSRVCTFEEQTVSTLHPPTSSHETMVELITGDILDDRLAVQLACGMDVIIHLAANTGVGPSVEDPRGDCKVNVMGTFNYLEAARLNAVRRFVFASSGAPIGECVPPIHEELAPHPVSPYGASKLAGEGYCSAYFRTFGVETVALRFGNVYGPGSSRKNSVVAKFIRKAFQGETLEIYGDGNQSRDFIYIDDLVDAVMQAATRKGVGGQVFQIATGSETTVEELVAELLPILSANGIHDVQVKHVSPRLGDVKRNFSDTSKASRILGWQTNVGLKEGLTRTVRWFSNSKAAWMEYPQHPA